MSNTTTVAVAMPPRIELPGDVITLSTSQVLKKVGHWRPNPDQIGFVWLGKRELRVLGTYDRTENWGPLLHVSVSYPDHHPSWKELKAIKQAFFGNVGAAMILPEEHLYVNVHEHVFHLWQLPERWEIA